MISFLAFENKAVKLKDFNQFLMGDGNYFLRHCIASYATENNSIAIGWRGSQFIS